MLKMAHLLQSNLFKQFMQDLVAFTLLKLMIQKTNISGYLICYDKAEQV